MITIISMTWIEERGDWEVHYRDERSGSQTGVRYINLPPEATEGDVLEYIGKE